VQVGDETRGWANGKGLVFDTSFVHETFNEGDRVSRAAAAAALARVSEAAASRRCVMHALACA
jgi:hypothetical protein